MASRTNRCDLQKRRYKLSGNITPLFSLRSCCKPIYRSRGKLLRARTHSFVFHKTQITTSRGRLVHPSQDGRPSLNLMKSKSTKYRRWTTIPMPHCFRGRRTTARDVSQRPGDIHSLIDHSMSVRISIYSHQALTIRHLVILFFVHVRSSLVSSSPQPLPSTTFPPITLPISCLVAIPPNSFKSRSQAHRQEYLAMKSIRKAPPLVRSRHISCG